jgi:hypothetical protein
MNALAAISKTTEAFLVLGTGCFLYLYFVLAARISKLFDSLGEPYQHSHPLANTTKLSLAFMKMFTLNLTVQPKTKQEKELVQEITRVVKTARILLAICVLSFLTAYIAYKLRG